MLKSAKQKVKESIMKNRKRGAREQGITLLALVITVIIIIILATVAISFLFGENGLITRAQQAKLQQEIETARETLTMVLGDAFIEKKINPAYDQNEFLDDFIEEREPNVYLSENAIGLDGHVFDLDRSVPELGEYQGELTGPRIQEMTITKESTSTVTVVVTAENAEGATYEYSYKKSTEGSHTFTGLTSETDYNIQVTVTDRAEHSVTEPTTVTTLEFTVGQTPEPEQGTTELADEDKENGVIEIKWLSGTSNNVSSTPNAPVIKEDLPAGTTMELVRYTGEGSTEQERWVPGTEYSYEPGIGSNDNTSSKWANARVTKDGIDSYFVWIPRYAYRIIYFDSAESKKAYREGTLTEKDAVVSGQIIGYSDSRGIVDAQGRKIKDVASTTKTMVSKDYFMTHPAFMNGTGNNYENGEWSTDIAGIWIGKYETSRSNATSSSSGSGTTLKVQPNVLSYRNVSIGSMYTYSLAYSEELQSHMLKNSEWGAVAYLTESKYGRNGTEIGFSDEGYITGGGADNAYATTNQDQSTTGNVYGIYDMRGGAYEYVASYYNGSTSLSNGSSFASNGGPSTKYTTAYTGTSESTSYKYGDATYETSGWHSDDAYFVFSSTPFFNRGGNYSDAATYAGVFYFGRYDGRGNSSYHSFRVSLVV